jgi:hypothetical protein
MCGCAAVARLFPPSPPLACAAARAAHARGGARRQAHCPGGTRALRAAALSGQRSCTAAAAARCCHAARPPTHPPLFPVHLLCAVSRDTASFSPASRSRITRACCAGNQGSGGRTQGVCVCVRSQVMPSGGGHCQVGCWCWLGGGVVWVPAWDTAAQGSQVLRHMLFPCRLNLPTVVYSRGRATAAGPMV